MKADAPQRPFPIGIRQGVVLVLLAAGLVSFEGLGITWSGLVPNEGGLEVARRFFSRALSPALSSEARFVAAGAPPLLESALVAAKTTLVIGAAAMGLSLLLGLSLGFLLSTAWWRETGSAKRGQTRSLLGNSLLPVLHVVVRALVVAMRSVHELLWAVLFLTALGLNELAAVFALAIPNGGTLAKIFSELVDEAPRDSAHAMRDAGASGFQVYCFALLPRAMPEMIAYAFYRFECVLRSAAVLGFFGFATLGLSIRQSFSAMNYGEVWTYLYVLLALLWVFDFWSGAIRRRLVM